MGGFLGLQLPASDIRPTTPPTPQPLFDMSKAVPLTPQEHPLFDMSKATPIVKPTYDFLGNAVSGSPAVPSGESADFWRGSPSIPGQAMQEAQTMSPQKMKEGAVAAGKTALTGAVAGSAALGTASALAPTAVTEAVGTGVLDASGRELMKDITRYGPSVARQVFSHPLAQQALKYAVGAAGGGAILKWLGLIGKAAE